MPSGGFTSPTDREVPVSTFTTIIPFVSMKVSITGQQSPSDKWAVLVKYRSAGERVLRSERKRGHGRGGEKQFACNEAGIASESWLLCRVGRLVRARTSADMFQDTSALMEVVQMMRNGRCKRIFPADSR